MATQISSPTGYEYHYRFSINYEILSYRYKVHPGHKTFLFEIRTNFTTKSTSGQHQTIGSERFTAEIWHLDDGEYSNLGSDLNKSLCSRLKLYWMTEEGIVTFQQEALDFVEEQIMLTSGNYKHAFGSVIPIVVNMEIRTVQQNGELLCSVTKRAIRPENLAPLYLFPWPCDNEGRLGHLAYYLLWINGQIGLKI